MGCRAEQRRRMRSATAVLRYRDDVLAVSEVAHDPTDAPTLDVLLCADAGGISPAVAGICANHGLTVRSVAPQGPHWQATLLV